MMKRIAPALTFALALMLAATPALAVLPDEILKDPALEARARTISEELRCMVCQNQSIDESDAPLARDLRLLIREQLVKGESDRQIMDYVHARYGDFVLLRPPFELRTLALWLTPFAALLLAIAALLWRRRDAGASAEKPLSDAERSLLDKALK